MLGTSKIPQAELPSWPLSFRPHEKTLKEMSFRDIRTFPLQGAGVGVSIADLNRQNVVGLLEALLEEPPVR